MLFSNVRRNGPVQLLEHPMPTAFEIGMSIQLVGWIAVQVMVVTLGFPNSRLYHYLYDGDELFGGKSS